MSTPRRLVLAGGGHSHVEVLRRFAARPLPDAAITLVTPEAAADYSGMLPGVVAGHYRLDETRIPLAPLAAAARATLVQDRIVALDLAAREAALASGTTLGFDALSLDVGSVPDARMAGARAHAIAVKPVPAFLAAWDGLCRAAGSGELDTVAVVGAGIGGIEIVLAMQHRLRETLGEAAPRFVLVSAEAQLAPQFAPGVRERLGALLVARSIVLHLGNPVTAITPGAVLVEGQRRIAADAIVLATSAAAAPWLAAAGLATDERGFVCVDAHLRSLSHPFVFAAGDCATLAATPHPKSGVFAVRHGPVLAANLLAHLTGSRLTTFAPQARALALIATGPREAILSWGPLSAQGRWVWRWKDRIDRRFVARYAAAGNPAAERAAGPAAER